MSKLSKALQAAAGNSAPQLAELYALGQGTYGALGNLVNPVGNLTSALTSQPTPFWGPWSGVSKAISGAVSAYFLIRSDGTLWTSGESVNLTGIGYTNPGNNLYDLTRVGRNTDWLGAKICIGTDNWAVALKADGTLWAWGTNSSGQFGQNNSTSTNSPIQIGSDTDWVDVSAGDRFLVAVKSDGTIWSCGNNVNGQLGLGDAGISKSSPTQIGALTDWAKVATGDTHTVALKTDGTLWAWGLNDVGQLGTGNRTSLSSPVQVGALTDWAKIYAKEGNSYSIKTDGTLWSWGDNSEGTLGQGNLTSRSSPVKVGAQTYWTDVVIGGNQNVQFFAGTSAWYVGAADNLLKISRETSPSLIGSNVKLLTHRVTYQNITAGKSTETPFHKLIFEGTYNVPSSRGKLVNDSSTAQYRFPVTSVTEPIPVESTSNWIEAAIAGYSVAAIREDGTLWTTGYNVQGELGIGNRLPQSSPVQVGALTDWAKISGSGPFQATNATYMAIKTDGTLWGWGRNGVGQIGDGTRLHRSSPVQIGALTNWASVSEGNTHTLAVKTNGTLWSWGDNGFGQLGQNTAITLDRSSPVQVGALTTWASVSAGNNISAAIKTDGTLWMWGDNGSGALGQNNATTLDRSSPVQVGALTNWSKVSAYSQVLAIKTDGTLWAWGNAGSGQLGDGTTSDKSSPVQIGSDTDWVDVVATDKRSYALKSDGSLYSWGQFTRGQTDIGAASGIIFLSDAVTFGYSSPVQIGTNKLWSKISNGCFILKND